jgi:hypothetical protein
MKISSDGIPTLRILEELMQYAIDDVRKVIPTACPANDIAEAKRTARDFFNTKFYESLCDLFNLPADLARKTILDAESTELPKEEDELSELPL